jgi:short subunit dehydrogenase-like uncharacterized protein
MTDDTGTGSAPGRTEAGGRDGAAAEIWVLGATGRTGRDIARLLAEQGLPVALVGRDRARLQSVADGLPEGARVLVAVDLAATAAAVTRERPAVVINTIGPFARTASSCSASTAPAASTSFARSR